MATPIENYTALMRMIRERFDLMDKFTQHSHITHSGAEIVAYNARKIVEGIAFGCLVAIDHGLKSVPRDAKGQYNAEAIFKSLKKKGLHVLPSPSEVRDATESERLENNVKAVIEGIPSHRLTHEQLIETYQYLHGWAHELNPYTVTDRQEHLRKNINPLIEHVVKLSKFISNHVISIQGQGFFCVLKDRTDGLTKVIAIQSVAA